MGRDVVNLPLEFDKLWAFFHQFDELTRLSPGSEEFRQVFGGIIKENSPSTYNEAKTALEVITGSLYYEMARGTCRTVNTRYGG